MSPARLQGVTTCAEEFVNLVLCYGVNVHEETAHSVTGPPVEPVRDVALKSFPPPISTAVGGTAPSL